MTNIINKVFPLYKCIYWFWRLNQGSNLVLILVFIQVLECVCACLLSAAHRSNVFSVLLVWLIVLYALPCFPWRNCSVDTWRSGSQERAQPLHQVPWSLHFPHVWSGTVHIRWQKLVGASFLWRNSKRWRFTGTWQADTFAFFSHLLR